MTNIHIPPIHGFELSLRCAPWVYRNRRSAFTLIELPVVIRHFQRPTCCLAPVNDRCACTSSWWH